MLQTLIVCVCVKYFSSDFWNSVREGDLIRGERLRVGVGEKLHCFQLKPGTCLSDSV